MRRIVSDFDNNGLARLYDDFNGQEALVDNEGNQIGEWHQFIENWGDSYYMIHNGDKKNLMRLDGTVVLKTWHNEIYEIKDGFFIFRNTIRKSKTNPQTRYIYGLANVSGDILFPMIFDTAYWMKDDYYIYAEINEKPYILTIDGGIYDPAGDHLPKKITIDHKEFFEKLINWTLSGSQFFYRDTDAPIEVNNMYHVGDVIRAGFFIDVTTKLLKPAHKIRYMIASAHVAMLFNIEDLCQQNPKILDWNLCVLHFNSYFQVLDIYEKDGVTQILLLHIPTSAAYFFGNGGTDIVFWDEITGNRKSIIEFARNSLDEKMKSDVHPRSLDQEFCSRMYHPIGLNNELHPLPLDAIDEPENGPIAETSKMVHALAEDADIEDYYKIEDNFPYEGVKGSICEKCVYSKNIQGNGECCGRLFINSFRNRYLKGRCEFRKQSHSMTSRFENNLINKLKEEKEHEEKSCDIYSLNVLKKFVAERLDGDIKKLKYFDLSSLRDDPTYGGCYVNKTSLMKSIMSLAFSDAYPDLTYETMEKYRYNADTINIKATIFGVCSDDYVEALETFNVPADLRERIIRFTKMEYTIGNTMVLRSGLPNIRDTKAFKRGYADVFLMEFYKVMTNAKKCNAKMIEELHLKSKEAAAFRTEQNFNHIVHELMLEDFLDEEGKPKQVFQGIFRWDPDVTLEIYIKAVNEFLDFCEPFIDKRADRIIEKLERLLNK